MASAVLKHDHAAAEDVAQATTASLWEKWPTIRAPQVRAVRLSWVGRTAFRNALHRSDKQIVPVDIVPERPGEEHEDAVVRRLTVELALASLPPALAETIQLRYEDDLSRQEIAQRLGVQPGTVANRLTYALRLLAEYFGLEED